MKIMLVGDFGVVHTRRYLDLIIKADCEVILLDRRGWRTFTKQRERLHYPWPVAAGKISRLLGRRIGTAISNRLVLTQLRLLMLWHRPDIIHVQWFDELVALMAKIRSAPVVATVWGTDVNGLPALRNHPTRKQAIVEAAQGADLIIADAPELIEILAQETETEFQSAILPIGIDTSAFCPGWKAEAGRWRRQLDIPDHAKVLMSPRALRVNYGHDLILRAFARILKSSEIDAYLLFKAYDCKDERYFNFIKNLALEHGVEDRVRILPACSYDQLPVFFAMGDATINFPDADGFPVTFLESLACQVPVVTKRLPAYESNIISSFLRFTEAATDLALADAIIGILTAGECVESTMIDARDCVVRHFDESLIAGSLRSLYSRLDDGRRRSPSLELDAISRMERQDTVRTVIKS